MGYLIEATDPESYEVVATLETHMDHGAAHALISALDEYYDPSDVCGDGDELAYTFAEISAAQVALMTQPFTSENIQKAQTFLGDIEAWFHAGKPEERTTILIVI